MNQIDLKGRVAVVTGGAQGIGYATAQRMLKSGATLALWDIDEAKLAEAKGTLSVLGIVSTVVVELTDEASVAAACAATLQQHARIDIARQQRPALPAPNGVTVAELDPVDALAQIVVEVNLNGPFLTSAAPWCRQMIKRRATGGSSTSPRSPARKATPTPVALHARPRPALIGADQVAGQGTGRARACSVNCRDPGGGAAPAIFDTDDATSHIDFMLSKIPHGPLSARWTRPRR